MSKGQHAQANRHGKHTTRGERLLGKIGLRVKRTPLKQLERELRRKAPRP